MNGFKHITLATFAAACLACAAPSAQAQVDFSLGPPSCPYGYGYAPYACAALGFDRPEHLRGMEHRFAGARHDHAAHADHMAHVGHPMHAGSGHEGGGHDGAGRH